MPEYQQNFLDEKKLSTIFLALPTYLALATHCIFL
jgi:hypothetical protein